MYQFWICFGDDRLSPSEKLLFIFFCDNQEYCSKSIQTIENATGLHRRTIISGIKKLEELGFISVQRHHRKPHIIVPLSAKKATLEESLSAKKATQLVAKSALNIGQKGHSNIKRTLKEQEEQFFEIDRKESGDGLQKLMDENGASNIIELVLKKNST